jgi:hypothetical protein
MVADVAGAFHTALPPGSYLVTAEGDDYLRGAAVPITVAAGASVHPAVEVPDAALLSYRVHDRAGNPIPAKVSVVGAQAAAPDRRFRDTVKDFLPLGVAASLASREGDSSKMTRYDHPLALAPGHYRVVVGRGPEWSRFEQVMDLTAAGAAVDVTLDRVIDTQGYLACDFHQHTNVSPDSPVPPEDRVVSYLAEGVEFIASTEHDVHFDYRPLIRAQGATGLLDAAVGVEVTPFDYGHFIGFPVPVDALSPNGGALDWGLDAASGLDQSPGEIFAGLRKLGAEVLEMNHPRAAPGSNVLTTSLRNFDRAGLAFDFAGRSFGGQVELAPVKAVELGLPDGAALFSPDFNAIEIYNGNNYTVADMGGERVDLVTDNAMRDWMNFLSFGFTPTAVGNSDSHQWVSSPAGVPRTMVRVADDSAAAIMAGVGVEVARVVSGGGVRDVVATNAPMIGFTVDGKGIGQTAVHAGGPVALSLRVQTPTWAPVDTVEVFANETFDIPPPKGQAPAPLVPVLCWTTRGAPSARCMMALNQDKTTGLVWSTVDVPGGGQRLEAKIDVMVDAATLLAHQRQGARGQDLWLVARATGDVGLFPTVPLGLTDVADVGPIVDMGTAALAGKCAPALAFTNPVFVDVDGGGWRAPFAP